MPIADKNIFSAEHIRANKFNASEILAEQAVHCLELVAELATVGLSFQFKGGNSLLLILDEPKRFSIDVDVASDKSREEIEDALNKIVAEFGVFSSWEHRPHKTKPWLPMTSYFLYYKSVFDSDPKTNIMFDVQMRRSNYKTEFKPVTCGALYTSGAKAELPLPSSIISDKLLTLGPATLGIPIGRGKEAQRLKHVYDVSRLSATLPDVSEMRESFTNCLAQENDLQQSAHTVADIVKDTLAFLFTTARFDAPPASADNSGLAENITGLEPFAKHLFESGYDWRALQRDMARAAVCMSAVGNDRVTSQMLHHVLTDAEKHKLGFTGSLGIRNSYAAFIWEAVYMWWGKDAFWI